MATVSPFRALHYDTTKITDLSEVITPPYDNIPAGQEQMYLARNPYNFAHIILPQQKGDDYTRAAALIGKWNEVGILKEETLPAYYLYRQYFTMSGKRISRDTLMCTVLLSDFSEGHVRPHENTYGQFREDRLQILRKTNCNLSHIFATVKDPDGFLASTFEPFEYQTPLLQGSLDAVDHIVWKIEGPKSKQVDSFFKDKPIYIVDGHHRYSSALQYAKETGTLGKHDKPAAYMLFAIANAYDPGLIVLPTHRAVKTSPSVPTLEKLSAIFEVEALDPKDLESFVSTVSKHPAFALYLSGKLYTCHPRDEGESAETHGKSMARLGVFWSDRVMLKDLCGVTDENRSQAVSYEKDATALWENRAGYKMIIFHATPAIDDIIQVADENRFMPQKSTYFFPKVAAGLVMRKLGSNC